MRRGTWKRCSIHMYVHRGKERKGCRQGGFIITSAQCSFVRPTWSNTRRLGLAPRRIPCPRPQRSETPAQRVRGHSLDWSGADIYNKTTTGWVVCWVVCGPIFARSPKESNKKITVCKKKSCRGGPSRATHDPSLPRSWGVIFFCLPLPPPFFPSRCRLLFTEACPSSLLSRTLAS